MGRRCRRYDTNSPRKVHQCRSCAAICFCPTGVGVQVLPVRHSTILSKPSWCWVAVCRRCGARSSRGPTDVDPLYATSVVSNRCWTTSVAGATLDYCTQSPTGVGSGIVAGATPNLAHGQPAWPSASSAISNQRWLDRGATSTSLITAPPAQPVYLCTLFLPHDLPNESFGQHGNAAGETPFQKFAHSQSASNLGESP